MASTMNAAWELQQQALIPMTRPGKVNLLGGGPFNTTQLQPLSDAVNLVKDQHPARDVEHLNFSA